MSCCDLVTYAYVYNIIYKRVHGGNSPLQLIYLTMYT